MARSETDDGGDVSAFGVKVNFRFLRSVSKALPWKGILIGAAAIILIQSSDRVMSLVWPQRVMVDSERMDAVEEAVEGHLAAPFPAHEGGARLMDHVTNQVAVVEQKVWDVEGKVDDIETGVHQAVQEIKALRETTQAQMTELNRTVGRIEGQLGAPRRENQGGAR